MTRSLLVMRDWLLDCGVTIGAMESTSTYWKGPFYCLEEVMECWLLNPAHMKAVPGRKTDVKDAKGIAQLLEHGLLRPSFVPPADIRRLRMLARYRVQLMGDRTRETTRLELMLEDASITGTCACQSSRSRACEQCERTGQWRHASSLSVPSGSTPMPRPATAPTGTGPSDIASW